MQLHGQCHCGNLALTLDGMGGPESSMIPARTCTCSFCVAHGCLWTSAPDGALELRVVDETLLTRYRFGTKTADFLLCARCGVVMACVCEIDGHRYAVVNIKAMRNIDPSRLQHAAIHTDGEETGARLARRQRHWISRVRLVTGAP